MASGDSADKNRETASVKEQLKQKAGSLRAIHTIGRMLMHKKAVQAECGKSESCTNKRQDADIQKQCSADNKANPSAVLNPVAMENNNNENRSPTEPINKVIITFQS